MTFQKLFELESYLVNAHLNVEQFTLKELTPVSWLTGVTKYGVWDSHKLIGHWIMVSFNNSKDANFHFKYLIENHVQQSIHCPMMLIQNNVGDYKLLISIHENDY